MSTTDSQTTETDPAAAGAVASDSGLDLQLDPDEAEFFLSQTGIDTIEELKSHILAIRDEALKVHAYPCIRRFLFVRLRMSKHPRYSHFVDAMKKDENAAFLDVGCCFGADIRKAIADGCPSGPDRIVGFDLHSEFWELGHKLFKDIDKMTTSASFIAGDILDTGSFLEHFPRTPTGQVNPQLQVKFIHASNLFHLFSEENQKKVAQHLVALLKSSTTGGMVFGSHAGRIEKGFRVEGPPPQPGMLGNKMFCHSPESWKEMWKEVWGDDGDVGLRIEAELVAPGREDVMVTPASDQSRLYRLVWSVMYVH